MLCFSAPFGALMRRNALYRQRNWVATLLELILPIGFAAIMLGIKAAVDTDSLEAKTVEAVTRDNRDTLRFLSFSDYVTAILAKRECKALGFDDWVITGIPYEGNNWQVPFVKCDARFCEEDGQDAHAFCNYPILAVAPWEEGDEGGLRRAEDFKQYVEFRYPQLLNTSMTHFPGDYEFVQVFKSNTEIDDYVSAAGYGNLGSESIGLAVVFDGDDPNDFNYALRVNSTNFNSPELVARPSTFTTPDTSILFSTYAKKDDSCEAGDAPEQGYLSRSCTGLYMYNGFLPTQRLLHDWILNATGSHDAGYFVSEHGVRYVPFPSRAYEEKGSLAAIAEFTPLLLMLGILYPCASMISYIVQEKELRQKELLLMMGITNLELGWSWFLSFWMLHIITATFVTIITTNIFESSNFLLMFFFWQMCFLAFVIMSMLLSTFASKASRGVLIGLLVVFGGFFLTLAVDVETGSSALISLLSIHPVTAMSYAMVEVGRLENLGVGVTPDSITSTDAPSGYTFSNAYGNLILSCIVQGFLTWYFNRVIRPDYGQAYPFYFPFSSSYWFPHRKHSEPYDKVDEADGELDDDTVPQEPVSDTLKQQSKDGESIEIKKLRKDFGEKVAVDGLNLTFYKGQVSALLGHNGAGKTTTISMLTGALSPTEGTAVIAGKDIRKEMGLIREDIGICLQHDCLFPKLTVREHIQFFSRVKGLYRKASHSVAEEGVDQTIRDVALAEKSNTFSSNLSGGMKRKLSLAIAFCGGSKVVFLDEPTSGMDPFARRFSWNVIRQYKQDRCIILTTHFMDEADILGDRIAIMSEGRLRCCGSSLFLKKTYGVGYQLTIEKQSKPKTNSTTEQLGDAEKNVVSKVDDTLKDIVMTAVPEAVLLSNVGTELSFQLPLGASDKFVAMFERLDGEVGNRTITTYGVSITTLDEVFQIVARGEDTTKQDFKSAHFSSKDVVDGTDDEEDRSVHSNMNLEKEGLFGTHVKALLRKRAANFKRDKRSWCCTTILPCTFVLVGLLLLKFAARGRDLEPLLLTLDDYNEDVTDTVRNPVTYNTPDSTFECAPGRCTFSMSDIDFAENEDYVFCGGPALDNTTEGCSITESEVIVSEIIEAGASAVAANVSTIAQSSEHILGQSNGEFTASQYGGIFFNHEIGSTTSSSGQNYSDVVQQRCTNLNPNDYLENLQCPLYGAGIGYTISYNFTALHVSPLFQALADEAIVRLATNDDDFKITPTVMPMPLTKKENDFNDSGDAFPLWFLIVLSFPFIFGAFATFVVSERESKAKHLQTVAGVTPAAYWLSTLFWDFINYLIPFIITIILFFAFDVAAVTTTNDGVIGGVIILLLLFGPAAAGFAYCASFGFKSPSACNIVLIVSGFLISMGASMTVFILRLIGEQRFSYNDSLVLAAKIIEWICRFFPPFCLGKGLLFAINIEVFKELYAQPDLSVFDTRILLIELIFLAIESALYVVIAIYMDVLSSNPEFMLVLQKYLCCKRSSERSAVAAIADDDDVVTEQQRVLNGGANDDAIVLSEISKIYPNGKIAVNKLSLGIPPGECFGLLGINGAGKTTTMAMLTAEFPPTEGDATLAGYSLRHEPEKTRRRIGYCPQFDAHFQNLTGREHVELYASIKGIPKDSVKTAAADKLKQVGLSVKDSDRVSSNYSGGMRRRLSLACATIGNPQLVFLDECSTGVDPVARREIWQLVSDLVSTAVPGSQKTSVVLTTHSMDECEALCPRIGIMANGKLRCLGSAQHLKTKFGKGFQLELKVSGTTTEDDDFQANLVALARSKGAAADEEAVSADTEIFLNLEEARSALQALTGDDYLSCMLHEANPTGYGVFKDATSPVGCQLSVLTSFVTNELRMRNLHTVVTQAYPTALLRERQDMKARFEVSSEGVSISQIFASIEENKEKLRLSDYGVSQTSLEQVFNMHAAEAERLKQGRMDG